MDRPCNDSIRKTLYLTEQMLQVADEGDARREDVGCGVLYGILRDSAYKIKQLAEQERNAHMRKGWWPRAEPAPVGAGKILETRCRSQREAPGPPEQTPAPAGPSPETS